MSLLEDGAYAGIIGGIVYLMILLAFRNVLTNRRKISWILQLEMALFMILIASLALTRSERAPTFLGIVAWTWLIVVVITAVIGLTMEQRGERK
ncbi:hypothetical protein PFDSM3638_05480 [Pyrococcus furiosus DSM 3638]|uniref:Uncharacterized protein n=2 Tax=Pyrococcus furiosus TaxID=2261 RepID=A0A5C0XVD2_PYRFU|nr:MULTISPECIES: hypothetical protein [Pyrococcus]AFN03886.1 hypothetical protein PFC_04695 [Pyrococcus furiosus COM1]MDK2868784.1 hypothetical protein [Pyrococcus sp.]QEK78750.1 hypothetical protein PFDSM3638_05480 [Pyrococcus furiosus DSM 3638]